MGSQTRRGQVQWRNQTPAMELAETTRADDLLDRLQVTVAVNARTNGRCYMPGCDERIISYPHAVPHGQGGVHHPVNRAGVCQVHRVDAYRRRGEEADWAFRLQLQAWLIDWYAERGVTRGEWHAMAVGQRNPPVESTVAHGERCGDAKGKPAGRNLPGPPLSSVISQGPG